MNAAVLRATIEAAFPGLWARDGGCYLHRARHALTRGDPEGWMLTLGPDWQWCLDLPTWGLGSPVATPTGLKAK